MPQPKAGGSFATAAWQAFADPVAVEHIAAHAGMDIGDTLIGMHLKDVAVPVSQTVHSTDRGRHIWYAHGRGGNLSAGFGRFMTKDTCK